MNIENIGDLKQRIKEELGMVRTPRNIDTFWVMKKVWDMHERKDDDLDTFISTRSLFLMGVQASVYQPYFAKYIEWDNTEWSYTSHKCRTIKSFTPSFKELMNDTKDLQIPAEIDKKYCHSTEDITHNTDMIEEAWNAVSKTPCKKYYTSTASSPFRVYHPLQGLKKNVRNEVFAGNYDVDIVSAHTTIAFNELNMSDCDLEMAWALHPENKNVLIDRIMQDFKCSEEKAKEIRCTLTATKKNFFGVKWFDNLHMEIERRAMNKFSTVDWKGKSVKINSMHKYFTWVEQNIISEVCQPSDVVLNFHDGLIVKSNPNKHTVTYNGKEYKLKTKLLG